MANRNFIQLQVTGDVDDSWHLTWQDPAWPPERHYHVDPQLLEAAAKEVRAELQKVVNDARANKSLGPSLKALARAGAELKKAIFLATGPNADAKFIRDSHLPSRDDWLLLISINQRVYLPWGLAYDGDPEALPDNPDENSLTPDLYAGFWCFKYQVCTLHGIIDPSGIKKPRSNDEVQMLTIVNQQVWEQAKASVPAAEIPVLDGALARSEPPISKREDFFKKYKKLYRGVDLLYLYCHANGQKLALSDDDEDLISVTKFQVNLWYDDRDPHPPCLVFLNGCQTAVGAEKGGFMKATGGPGFCGFIGTEAKVPDLFALRFAARFFWSLLYEELTVAEIMNRLRREHFPLGLVYSTCCHPLFKIKRINPAPAVPVECNLSTEQLLANTLL